MIEFKLKKRNQYSKLYIHTKKKKTKLIKKKKLPYDYQGNKTPGENSVLNNVSNQRQTFTENYYTINKVSNRDSKLILANSSKKKIITLEPHAYDFSTIDSRRGTRSYLKGEPYCKSAANIPEKDAPMSAFRK